MPLVRPQRTQAMTNFVDLDALSPATLRHLAAIKERALRDRYDDTDAMAEELAQMLLAGTRPTIGWYRRHLVRE